MMITRGFSELRVIQSRILLLTPPALLPMFNH